MEHSAFVARIQELLSQIQDGLLREARDFRDSNIQDVSTYEELQEAVSKGYWARAPWAGEPLLSFRHNFRQKEPFMVYSKW